MPQANVFDRTAIFSKEKMNDGKNKIRRIPWDLIRFGSGLKASPVPNGDFHVTAIERNDITDRSINATVIA